MVFSLLDQVGYMVKHVWVKRLNRLDHLGHSNVAEILAKHPSHHLIEDTS
jgi:hypothetical protein